MPEHREPGSDSSANRPTVQSVETALRRLGYAKVAPTTRPPGDQRPNFWVQEPGVPRRLYPVFIEESLAQTSALASEPRPAILVVPDESRAVNAWRELRAHRARGAVAEISILVLAHGRPGGDAAHWHTGAVDRRELLDLATGVIVGMFRRAASEGDGAQIDFGEMLEILKGRFHIDLAKTLGVEAQEDILWMMYHLAMRFSYAPGDPGGSLHLLVLKPTGPAARLPWFAA
ncbi:MAG TPA: hypothetical protein VGV89_06265 [Thermoplasmata archaeon]|nr:hypothetical protein [Thermoplasmata archaeon]